MPALRRMPFPADGTEMPEILPDGQEAPIEPSPRPDPT